MDNYNKEQPKISVIVLTYNHEKYIRQTLESILMQNTKYAYEILIGDDASEDGTSDIVCEYAEKYPDIISAHIREKNLGATENLYQLLNVAKGDYIASCEGDDFWSSPNKLQMQIEYLENNLDVVGCTHICGFVDENNNPINMNLKWISEKSVFRLDDFKGYILPGHPATLVYRNIFKDTKHDFAIIKTASSMVADRTIVLILLLYGDIHQLKDVMSCYRIYVDRDTRNLTNVMFKNNPDSNLMQYRMAKKLENYTYKEFGIEVFFRKFKIEQCVKYVIKKVLRKVGL